MTHKSIYTLLLGSFTLACASEQGPHSTPNLASSSSISIAPDTSGLVRLSDNEWRQLLTKEQFSVTRNAGTERAFSGVYWDEHDQGIYQCIGCAQPLFNANTKYTSGTGWPSFWQPVTPEAVSEHKDKGLFSTRTEIRCSRCDAHLGHVFDDGPKPTGLRYCMNSAALNLLRAEARSEE